MRLAWTRLASIDRKDIREYIAADNPTAALALDELISEKAARLEGIPRDRHLDALNTALDALDLTDEQRITALTSYFQSLAAAQPPSPALQDWMDRFGAPWPEGAPAPDYTQKPQKGP